MLMFEQPGICLLSDKMRLLTKIGNVWKTESQPTQIKTKSKSLVQLQFSVQLEQFLASQIFQSRIEHLSGSWNILQS